MLGDGLEDKLERLLGQLRGFGSVAVAFSGGVDSSLLLRAAKEALGERVLAVTVESDFFPATESAEAKAFCEAEGVRQVVCRVEETEVDGFCANPPDRCYLCKRHIFSKIREIAEAQGAACIAEGSNADDVGDYRPGLRAVAELGVYSPLREAGLHKSEIRELSRRFCLPTWEKPSFACLASRFVYGEEITKEKLRRVDAAERLLAECGFRQFRVRIHGDLARIEVLPEEFARLLSEEIRSVVEQKLREYGFTYVTMDLKGYRMGSMNEALKKESMEDR